LDVEVLEFGKQLIETEDLDPVYCYLNSAKDAWDGAWLERWLLTYSMFYHSGVAELSAQLKGHEYWDFIKSGIPNEAGGGFPRSEERRHFRGHTAQEAIKQMSEYEPKAIVDSWYVEPTFQGVIKNVQRLKFYGPWIAFKLADMGERVLGLPIDFSDCELGIYREPRAGAALVKYGDSNHPFKTTELTEVVNYIIQGLDLKAPPRYDRHINVQEAETILCKYKSMKHGHYYVGKDNEAVAKALQWRRGDTTPLSHLHYQ
jgi:hypothetical protein